MSKAPNGKKLSGLLPYARNEKKNSHCEAPKEQRQTSIFSGIEYKTHAPQETTVLASKIASLLRPKDVILLKGELGTGKTTFARALIQSLCRKDTEVPSPTFTLVQTYETPKFILWHFDLYRLIHSEEVHELGIEEAYASGVSLIEWPERLGTYLPKNYLEIEIRYGSHEHERILSFRGWNDRFS